jgi:hypothetical protein
LALELHDAICSWSIQCISRAVSRLLLFCTKGRSPSYPKDYST